MAEETRRSGRATKGQYTKDRDVVADAASKRKGGGKGKGSKAKHVEEEEEEDENTIIRCVCGEYDEEDERIMICCDNCDAWQHNDCMGLADDYAPETYFCEQCKPTDHKKLLAAMSKGEKPWEETARQREAAATAAVTKKKPGKKGRKSGAATDASASTSQDVEESGTPGASARGGQKRKMESPAGDLKGVKKARSSETPSEARNGGTSNRKSSAMPTPSRQASRSEINLGPVVNNLDELSNAQRKTAATQLSKLFVDQTKSAVKQGAFNLPKGLTADALGAQLGLAVEHALYYVQSSGSGEPSEAYKTQLRTIVFNVKKNPDLRDRLVTGDLSPHALASMNPEDMASEDQQKRDAAIKADLDKQSTIIQEQGPRIRRTHKGEEYIDESQQIAEESKTSHVPQRKPSIMEDENASRSPDVAQTQITRPTSQGRPRPSIDTQRKSSQSFDIDTVWSTVQGSPDGNSTRFPEMRQQSPANVNEPAGPGTRADADIDALLKDEDAESAPYSPKDYTDDDGIVWRGRVVGTTYGTFTGAARFAAGAKVADLHLTYRQLIPQDIDVGGRIDPSKADDYLCGLQYSHTSDIVVVSIAEPEDPYEKSQFTKLFQYFKSRKRYGVGVQHANPAVKDIYLIPLDTGEQLPTLMGLLPSESLSNPVTAPIFLVPIVIKNTEIANAGGIRGGLAPPTPQQQTPMTPFDGAPDYNPQFQHQPPPINGAGPPYQQPYATPPPGQFNSPAAAAAHNVLGPDLARAPAVSQLVLQAPTTRELEMGVVKECIAENPHAANDLNVLIEMLQARYNGSAGHEPGPTA